ncbi:peptidase family M48-domain-containing protein [Cristinia sonorae]|uniref:Peptidase family M48-domain-containing protein n=1 Tax=Cristinia sonorae TaxID=1940300 RepID=A0A8K0XT94_9AGAR|nr:peptidase family M48-domain-containing protein [Cristinia sonorae]
MLRSLRSRTLSGFRLTSNLTPRSRSLALPTHTHTPAKSKFVPLQTRYFSSNHPHQNRYVRFGGEKGSGGGGGGFSVKELRTGYGVVFILAGTGALYYVLHLEQVPETGRWRFMDVSPKYETELAEESRQQLLHEFKGKILPADHPLTRHVRRVVTRLLDANDLGTLRSSGLPRRLQHQHQSDPDGLWNPDAEEVGRTEDVAPGVGGREWELLVVNDDKVVNAMASYGNVIVFTGILPVAKDEEGLAAILGHEIGHVVARHNSERYSQTKIFIGLAYLLNILGLDFGFSQLALTLLYQLPNSRAHEYEADKIGLSICAKACYDPRASPAMFDRLRKFEGRTWDFMSTHPAGEKRIKQLEAMLPQAYELRAASPACGGMGDAFGAFSEVFGSARW